MSGSRVIHSDDLPWETGGRGELFVHRRRRLGAAAGGEQLGCSMMELDPGKTAWPFHFHQANEEAIYVLAGEATLRLGPAHTRVRAGDYVALPTGSDHAHQLTNTGSEVLRYLVISTMTTPDVCVYPDANKVGVVGALTGADGQPRRVVTFPRGAEVGYWEGETTDLDDDEGAQTPAADAARRVAREAVIDQQVEADLEALRRKVAQRGDATTDRPAAGSAPTQQGQPPAPDAPDPVEAELEALRRKVAQQGGSSSSESRASRAPTEVEDPSTAELDDLKRTLDGE